VYRLSVTRCMCIFRVILCVRLNLSPPCRFAPLLEPNPANATALTCHDMGSHDVTCHPAEVTFPPLPQPRFSDPRRDATLS